MEPVISSAALINQSHIKRSGVSFKRIYSTLAHWQHRSLSRRELALLDTRLLADVGISEAQRKAEVGKPFWR